MARFTHKPEKLKSIAAKLSVLMPSASNPTDVYTSFFELYKKQYEYFTNFAEEDLIKIVIYLWSIIKTGSSNYADDIFKNIFFAGLIHPKGEKVQEECPECDGNGEILCGYCEGEGNVRCDECDGDGAIQCSNCDGDGQVEDSEGEFEDCDVCKGDGVEECSSCSGEGSNRCDECLGYGRESCQECNGIGEIETDKDGFYDVQILSWSTDIFNRCEMTQDTDEPALSEKYFDEKSSEEFIVLSSLEEGEEFKHDLDDNYYYCYDLDDSPKLFIDKRSGKFRINFNTPNINFYYK